MATTINNITDEILRQIPKQHNNRRVCVEQLMDIAAKLTAAAPDPAPAAPDPAPAPAAPTAPAD